MSVIELKQHFERMESYLPINLLEVKYFLITLLTLSLFIIFRYFFFTFPVYWLTWKKSFFSQYSLHDKKLPKNQIRQEIKWSLISTLIFSLSGIILGILWQNNFTLIYLKFNQYPFWYFPISLVLISLLHELYFYFSHRLMHRPKLFKRFHKVHHDSKKTTPWTSFSFHPFEAIVNSLFLVIAPCLIPIHPTLFLVYLTLMTLSAINNHMAVELLPRFLRNSLISSHHHQLHHSRYNGNYGLYFCFSDKLFKTEIKS
jgi:sterol desaturase/sphingolipid hydroxylase (fatty acid hydroxylase superfamily)